MSQLIRGKDHTPLSPVPHTITYVLDLGGVLGTTGQRGASTPGVTSLIGPIDVKDTPLRQAAWDAWTAVENTTCVLCGDGVDIEVYIHIYTILLPLTRRTTSPSQRVFQVALLCSIYAAWLASPPRCYLKRSNACVTSRWNGARS